MDNCKATKATIEMMKKMSLEQNFDEDKLIATVPLPGKMIRTTTKNGKIDFVNISVCSCNTLPGGNIDKVKFPGL